MALASIHNRRGFFSDYWLGTLHSARGAGGAQLTPAQARRLLDRLQRILDAVNGTEPPDLTRYRERFARPLFEDILGFALRENGEEPRLRPLAAGGGQDAPIAAAVHLAPEAEALDALRTRRALEDALAAWRLDYGFVLTPEVLRLVRRPGLGARGAALDVHLASLVEQEDIESLTVLYRLLAARNFVPGADGRRPMDALEEESRRHSARVSEDLKDAVFEAAERIVGGFLADVRARAEAFSPTPTLSELRDAGFLALYRLLFILYAEARDERLNQHAFYQKSYSLDGIVRRLLRAPLETLPANRYGLWPHLQALFRIFNEGIEPHLPELENIPPRGGRLFSEETPEGLLLRKLRLDDRTAAAVLLALATTRPRRGVGRERVSFRELDIEQLGNVYQGLLEYEPEEARGTLIECRVAGRDYVLAPAELVRLVETKSLAVAGDARIVEGTDAAWLHPAAASGDDTGESDEAEEEVESEAGEEEEEADTGVQRGATLKLLRRLEPGEFFFKPGSARKASGSYYTPTEIVDYLGREALAPLVVGRSAAEIEKLRVMDLACGSAHFLVGAARFLGDKLLEAYQRELSGDPPPAFYPDRKPGAEVRSRWAQEGRDWCKRRIVEHCLYGVDLNPAAVQLAQVALWIESLAGDRPLSFFAHHIRCGNSLLGSSLEHFDQPPHPGLGKPDERRTLGLFEAELKKRLAAALEERKLIDAPLPPEVRADTPEEYAYKEDRLRRAEAATRAARLLLDLRSASPFVPAIWRELPQLMASMELEADCRARPWWPEFESIRERERFFHWELEFPEVLAEGGFDCVLGNPPWEKVKPDRKEFYGRADVLIRAYAGGELDARIRELQRANPVLAGEFIAYSERLKTIAQCLKRGGDYRYVDWEINGRSTGGDPDLFKFFVERAEQVLKPGGRLGYLVPSAVYNNEGCTGLRHLLLDEMKIERFFGFENRNKIFSIDSRYKFVCLVAEKGAPGPEHAFAACFMRHELEELESGPPNGVTVIVRRSEIERLSPGTLAFLEFRGERDRELVLKMYGLREGDTPRPLLGAEGHGTWNTRFWTEFHMTNDRDLWTRDDGRLYTPREVCGLDWPANGAPFAEVRAAMAERGFWPLYEGKQIEQFTVDLKPVERWVSLEAAERKYGKPPTAEPKLVFRDIASNTNERTCIAAVLPERSCANNKLPIIEVGALPLDVACTVLNSFPFDFQLRFRVSSTINFTHISRVAVPPLADCRAIPAIPTRSADLPGRRAGGGADWTRDPEYFEVVWQANRAVAQAYGLGPDDLAHILSTFPVFVRKRPEFHAFLLARLAEWRAQSA